jgi:hypothetical protein
MVLGRNVRIYNNTGAKSALTMRGDEYILSFLFTIQLQFRQTNNAEHENKQ